MDFLKRHKPKFAVALAVVAMIGVFHYIGDRVTAEDGGVVDHSVRRGDGFIGCEERGMRTKDNWLEIANANVANGLDPLTDVCHIVDGSVIDFTCDRITYPNAQVFDPNKRVHEYNGVPIPGLQRDLPQLRGRAVGVIWRDFVYLAVRDPGNLYVERQKYGTLGLQPAFAQWELDGYEENIGGEHYINLCPELNDPDWQTFIDEEEVS